MDETTRAHLDNVASGSTALQDAAYHFLMPATDQPVDWAYEAWDTLLNDLRHKDNKTRAIAAQVLANVRKPPTPTIAAAARRWTSISATSRGIV